MFTFCKNPLFIGISAVNIEVNNIKSKFLLYESDAQHRLHEKINKPQIAVITQIELYNNEFHDCNATLCTFRSENYTKMYINHRLH